MMHSSVVCTTCHRLFLPRRAIVLKPHPAGWYMVEPYLSVCNNKCVVCKLMAWSTTCTYGAPQRSTPQRSIIGVCGQPLTSEQAEPPHKTSCEYRQMNATVQK